MVKEGDREEVRAFVQALFERWKIANEGRFRGEGIAEFARQAGVGDGSLRVWLGRAGPAKAEKGGAPSALYLIRMLRIADALKLEDAPQPPRHHESLEDQVRELAETVQTGFQVLAEHVAALLEEREASLPLTGRRGKR